MTYSKVTQSVFTGKQTIGDRAKCIDEIPIQLAERGILQETNSRRKGPDLKHGDLFIIKKGPFIYASCLKLKFAVTFTLGEKAPGHLFSISRNMRLVLIT
ncbi:hypothetical protein SNE26_26440 [Mucilaginibacter sp. cycad4]|uniref:hypothetical protein n=1 Tax=Mucilaginibacter sp. cycad4 TaxID=3342096 RepID=UPI002AABDE0B|nr:hypothetical protein [Mucilaginibacter gossypii]WPU99559.1 hypothetical protein SNE26_26440 [Mucilaginibacter gossypii]